MSFSGEHIWIIGASSGIGRALALDLAAKDANLVLSARRRSQLEDLVGEIRQTSPESQVKILPVDVSKEKQLAEAFDALKTCKIDRIIHMAAIYTPPGPISGIRIDTAKQIMDVNFIGALRVSQKALALFKHQGSGQLALCASVAGYFGLPRGQVYSASKAALINLAESLACEAPDYIDVKLINPGFVETPMTAQNDFDMPMLVSPAQAASAVSKGLTSSGFEIHFPRKFTIFMKLLRLLPYRLALFISAKIKT